MSILLAYFQSTEFVIKYQPEAIGLVFDFSNTWRGRTTEIF